jgi:hypothetical protein
MIHRIPKQLYVPLWCPDFGVLLVLSNVNTCDRKYLVAVALKEASIPVGNECVSSLAIWCILSEFRIFCSPHYFK